MDAIQTQLQNDIKLSIDEVARLQAQLSAKHHAKKELDRSINKYEGAVQVLDKYSKPTLR